MKILVTADDIENGLRNNCFQCPVALAIFRTLPTSRVKVTETRTSIWDMDGRVKVYYTPLTVSQFIRKYDHEQFVEPFSFELDIPC
jgi:hypothetical protein